MRDQSYDFSGVRCLSDIPSPSATKLYNNIDEKPGITYSADAQCTMFFGGSSKSCVRKTVSYRGHQKYSLFTFNCKTHMYHIATLQNKHRT